ncbi:MAG: 2-amino-4-hydroxy-6-hydroxymethyldihydropteridine diphosphokinase [Gemmatimonadales bacterium]
MKAVPVRAYIALGSNLGNREGYLALARERLARLPATRVLAGSAVEETVPLEGLDQPNYLNQMVAVDTSLTPRELLAECRKIERLAGRERRTRWASRTLDLDLVRYADLVTNEAGLQLPHPGLSDRPFWQRELAQLEERGF